jgi:3-polyprenyl-4-hydroxybenzoate decarboxylase
MIFHRSASSILLLGKGLYRSNRQSIAVFGIYSSTFKKSFSSAKIEETAPKVDQKKSIVEKLWGKEASIASSSFKSRWLMLIPVMMTQMSIGKEFLSLSFTFVLTL